MFLLILALAASESVVGLSLVLKYYFETESAYVQELNRLRG